MKQKTVIWTVDDEVRKVTAKRKTYRGNLVGWYVDITVKGAPGFKIHYAHLNCLTPEEAIEIAKDKYENEHWPQCM